MADAADSAQIEIDREIERNIANLKQPDVEPTDACIECGGDIPKERQKHLKTNICVGCAELKEIRNRNYRR